MPADDGTWAASVGLKQNVTHRVLIKDDGSSCLEGARGNKIRCTDGPVVEQPAGYT
ncbi:hypothetical protein [Arthrobacter sp. Br18]|uniref:hypothetical protein n=1 Tax=Arthrobacter sp. Br18 TaxID=1312954 RepID=UPI0004B9F1F5|nr:hypothetical protein [Arthrobacter sp. Br18]